MSKRRGFTLTEIVVVIALTSLVLAMVGGCLYFVSSYSGALISKSEELTKVQTIETHLRSIVGNKDSNISISKSNDNDNNISISKSNDNDNNNNNNNKYKLNGILIQYNSDNETLTIGSTEYEKIDEFSFEYYNENGVWAYIDDDVDGKLLRCKITYVAGETYTFILGIVNNIP